LAAAPEALLALTIASEPRAFGRFGKQSAIMNPPQHIMEPDYGAEPGSAMLRSAAHEILRRQFTFRRSILLDERQPHVWHMASMKHASRLARLTDAAPRYGTPTEVAEWTDAMSAEIDRLQSKGERLRKAALRWPDQRRIDRANEFCDAVETEVNRAVATLRRLRAMFFDEPPSTNLN
jgi:hypothetical protein